MAQDLIQTNFTAGEFSPLLDGRTDLSKYANAVHVMENFINDPRGPAVFRPGFKYITSVKNSAKKTRLVPFQFSTEQAYMLEFGDQYIRFYKDKAQIQVTGVPYEIASPYLEADIEDIDVRCQSADVLYLLHPSYQPRKLSRTGHTSWVLSVINFKPPAISEQSFKPVATLTLSAVTGIGITATASAAVFLSGDVGKTIISGAGVGSITAFTSSTVVELEVIDDFASTSPIASQSWSMRGTPNKRITPDTDKPTGAIVTVAASETVNDYVDLLGEDQNYWTVSSVAGTYYLKDSAPGYTSIKPAGVLISGIWIPEGVMGSLGIEQWAFGDNDTLGFDTIYIRLSDGTDPDTKSTVDTPNNSYVRRSPVPASAEIFRSSDVGKYIRVHGGLIEITSIVSAGSAKGVILKELTAITDTNNWSLESAVWSSTNGYPSCATLYGERLVLAGSTAYPETMWGSVVGGYENFTPGVDDSDSFEFTLGGNQVKKIFWLEEKEALIAGTPNGPCRIGPEDSSQPLTPLNVQGKRRGTKGCADLAPITINESTLYIQKAGADVKSGKKIREFTYQWEQNGYTAPDLLLLAEHVSQEGISGITFQEEPNSTIWGWTTDGKMVSCTYLREQDVTGWHRHPTTGTVTSMACIPGVDNDEVWRVVTRTINGQTVQYIEVLAEPFTDTEEEYRTNKGLNAFFVDSGITYSGAATTTITGLSHLEGEEVVILADGSYVSRKTVTGGQITLNTAASVVHAGLEYTGTLQTMRLDPQQANGTSQGKVKKIHDLTVRVYRSGAFKCGRDANNLDSMFDRERTLIMGGAYPLFTGDIPVGFDGKWERDGRLMIVQDKPMPLTVVALMAQVTTNG